MKDEVCIVINGIRYEAYPRKEGSETAYCYDNCDLYEFCKAAEERTKQWIGFEELKKQFYMSDVCSGLLDSDKFYFRKAES